MPQPAKPVDLARYTGRWYELIRYEQSFERDCEGVTADYSRNANGSIKVVNTCFKGGLNGPRKLANGKAKVVDTATNAKLKVSFFGPFYGNYWVLDHADDYSWSIVGEPSGRYLWLLSRSPQIDAQTFDALRQRIIAMGYDWSIVRVTKHNPVAVVGSR